MRAGDHLDPSDLDLLGVEVDDVADDGRSGRFALGRGLIRHDGALYGGTGLAVSVLAMEAASGRDVLWATTQFVSSPLLGTELRWQVEVLAEGRRSTQLLVRTVSDDGVVLTALGSAGRPSEDGLTGRYRSMPRVAGPDTARPWAGAFGEVAKDSWHLKIDLRETELLDPWTGDGTPPVVMWVRRQDGRPFTPVAIAFSADFVPLGVARSAGRMGAGSSLDNSLRFRPGPSTEWVLLELHGDFAYGGYGHGTVLVWDQDGDLLASGSQTAAMKYLWNEGEASRLPTPRD